MFLFPEERDALFLAKDDGKTWDIKRLEIIIL